MSVLRMKAIVRKDLLEIRRGMPWFLMLMPVVMSPLMLGHIISGILRATKMMEMLGQAGEGMSVVSITGALVMVAPLVLPTSMNGLLSRGFVQEQNQGSLLINLSTGVSPGVLWISKLIATFG